jgi:hypothetical protein
MEVDSSSHMHKTESRRRTVAYLRLPGIIRAAEEIFETGAVFVRATVLPNAIKSYCLGPIVIPDSGQPRCDVVQGLLPGNTLPLVLTTLPYPPQRVVDSVRVVY